MNLLLAGGVFFLGFKHPHNGLYFSVVISCWIIIRLDEVSSTLVALIC